jgi:hypothetical protein
MSLKILYESLTGLTFVPGLTLDVNDILGQAPA